MQTKLQTWAKSNSRFGLAKPFLGADQMEHTAFFVKSLLIRVLPTDLQESVADDLEKASLFEIPKLFRQSKARSHEVTTDSPHQVAYASNSQDNRQQYNTPTSKPHPGSPQHGSYTRNNSYHNTRPTTSHYTSPQGRKRYPAGTPFTPTRDMCYACLRDGHIAPHCPHPRRCPFHGEVPLIGHSFAACKKYPDLAKAAMDTIRKFFNAPRAPARQQNRSVFFQSAMDTTASRDQTPWELELDQLVLS